MKRRLGMALLALLVSDTAFAGTQSWITGGFGTTLGYRRTQDFDAEANAGLAHALEARLQLLGHVALQLGYAPGETHQPRGELAMDGALRLTALLYPVHQQYFGLYLAVGISASNFRDLFSVKGETTGYHGGGGFEVYLDDRFSLGLSFLMLVPGITSAQETVANRALTGLTEGETSMPSLSDFLSPENFRAAFSAHYYF